MKVVLVIQILIMYIPKLFDVRIVLTYIVELGFYIFTIDLPVIAVYLLIMGDVHSVHEEIFCS